MNEAVFDICKATGIELTRSRAYKKNDQAWVEQKNGAIVRRLVGYGRLRGHDATQPLASPYEVSRLYINLFQPSFKLKSKTRHGVRVTKHYEAPLTPLERMRHSADGNENTWSRFPRGFPGQSWDRVAGRRGKTDASPKGARCSHGAHPRRSVRAYVTDNTAMA